MHEANTKKTKYIMFNIMCKEENIINIVKIKDYLLYIYEVVDTTYTDTPTLNTNCINCAVKKTMKEKS